MKFICPICSAEFCAPSGAAIVCERGHSFDRSREGYYNFLLSSSSGIHGDNREMLRARRDFLNTGAYYPLAKEISEQLLLRMPRCGTLLDAGCGEGYYTDIFERALRTRDQASSVSAFDVSKDAVRLAAKRNPALSLAVASSYKIPAADNSFDALVSIFSPLAKDEFNRVLKKGGTLIIAIPDKLHLFGLKSFLYERPYENRPEQTALEGFNLYAERRVAYSLDLDDNEKIMRLFKMTPYAYRTPPEAAARLALLDKLECRAEFIVLCYEKT